MPEREPRSPRQTYHSEIERLLDYRGKTYADIARDIGLTSLGAKRPGEMLRECASPEAKIIGYDYGFSRALIARILTANDEKTYKKLLRLSRRDRRTQRAKTASVTDSPIRDERELYAMSAEDAADILEMTEAFLLRLEQGKRKNDAKRERCIITIIRQEGERRMRDILERTHDQPTSIRQIIPWIALRKKLHGYGDSLQQLSNRLPGIGREILQYIIKGKDMPPLPVIKRILDAGEILVTEELTQDWAYEFALHEKRRSPTQIGRALQCISAETYESHGAFERLHGTGLKKSLERIQRGDVCELKSIHKALRQLKVTEESPRWLWIESLYKERSISSALPYWGKQMHAHGFPIHGTYAQLPGLTPDEQPRIILDAPVSPIATQDLLKESRRRAVMPLIMQAKHIDPSTFDSAPDRIIDTLYNATQKGCTDHATLLHNTLTVERAIQWAFTYNLTIASPYYHTLRRAIEESIEKRTPYEEIQKELQTKIDAIVARDTHMALGNDAPGIHQAKSKTGRKLKGANNY